MARYTNAQFLEAIKGSGGIVSAVADKLDCAWNTANKRIKDNKKLTRAFFDEMEFVDDLAEAKIIKSIKDGNTQDAKWWLARRRKEKFSERQELTGKDGEQLQQQTVIILPSNDRNDRD